MLPRAGEAESINAATIRAARTLAPGSHQEKWETHLYMQVVD
jgi:hypothetical protein